MFKEYLNSVSDYIRCQAPVLSTVRAYNGKVADGYIVATASYDNVDGTTVAIYARYGELYQLLGVSGDGPEVPDWLYGTEPFRSLLWDWINCVGEEYYNCAPAGVNSVVEAPPEGFKTIYTNACAFVRGRIWLEEPHYRFLKSM